MIKYFIFPFFVLFFSCSRQDKLIVIDIQDDSVIKEASVSEIAEKVTAIPLETNDLCLLSLSEAKKDDSLLFILSNQIIYLFDINGKFIKQLTQPGRGPGEMDVREFVLDKVNQEVIAYGPGRTLIRYKYDGSVISQTRVQHQFFEIREFILFHDSYWAIAFGSFSKSGDYEMWLLRLNGEWKIQDSTKLFQPDIPDHSLGFNAISSFSTIDNKLYYNVSASRGDRIKRDTLYCMDDSGVRPVLRVNYGLSIYHENPSNPFLKGYSIRTSPIRVNKRFLFTRYSDVKNYHISQKVSVFYFCYDFRTKRKYHLEDGFIDDIYHTGLAVYMMPLDSDNDEYYYFKNSDELSKSFPERTENDNPVLFIITLKK